MGCLAEGDGWVEYMTDEVELEMGCGWMWKSGGFQYQEGGKRRMTVHCALRVLRSVWVCVCVCVRGSRGGCQQ